MKGLFLKKWNAFIRYNEIPGKGETVVYLPGLNLPARVSFFSTVMHQKLQGFNSFLVDYLGSGSSDYPKDFDHSIENHANAVAAILDHQKISKCSVIGHSMGGVVGITLAHLRPNLINNLIVCEGNITPGGGDFTSWIVSHSETEYVTIAHPKYMEEIRAAASSGDRISEFISCAWQHANPLSIYRNSKFIVDLDPMFKGNFFGLQIPRTFVYGEKSLPENTGKIKADIPDPKELTMHGINVKVVPNAGHFMMIDNLPDFVEILNTIVRR